MYVDSQLALTVDPTDTLLVEYQGAGEYVLTVRDRLGTRALTINIPGEQIVELEGAIGAARTRRLIDATKGIPA